MESDAERFIELATRPLADDAELLLSAQTQLREAIGDHPPAALAEAVDSLTKAEARPRRHWWKFVLAAVMLAVSLPLLGMSVLEFKQLFGFRFLFTMHGAAAPLPDPQLSPAEKLLLHGAEGESNEADRWRPLWESDPDNPVYLAEYAKADFSTYKQLSAAVLAAAERIDPDNAWFPALAAAGIAEGAVSKVRMSGTARRKAGDPAPVWTIDDETRLNDALAAIHDLAGKPRFTAYQSELWGKRHSLFPPPQDLLGQFQPLVCLFSQTSASIHFRKLADVLAAGAQQCAAKGDVAGFRQITADWKFLSAALAENSETLVDCLIARVFASGPLANFRDAAKTLGLGEEAAYFSDLADRFERETKARNSPRSAAAIASEDSIRQRSSLLFAIHGNMVARQVKHPPALTEEDLRPGRYADHALFERVASWVAWAVLGVCAGATALSQYFRSRMAARLSTRMQDLLCFSDGVWAVLGGLVLPVLWYLAITRLTPLAAREWSMASSLFRQPSGQFGCLILAMVILPAVIVSSRLAKRGAAVRLVPRFPWIGWSAAVVALAGIPAFGGMGLPGPAGGACKTAAYACLGISALWILGEIAMNFFDHGHQVLRRATLARALPSVWVVGMLMMVGLTFWFHAEEGKWIRQDRFFTATGDSPMPLQWESRVTGVLRGELLEMIRPPAEDR